MWRCSACAFPQTAHFNSVEAAPENKPRIPSHGITGVGSDVVLKCSIPWVEGQLPLDDELSFTCVTRGEENTNVE